MGWDIPTGDGVGFPRHVEGRIEGGSINEATGLAVWEIPQVAIATGSHTTITTTVP
jgi:hypothetical protein